MGIDSGEGWPEKLWEQLTANWGLHRTQRERGWHQAVLGTIVHTTK